NHGAESPVRARRAQCRTDALHGLDAVVAFDALITRAHTPLMSRTALRCALSLQSPDAGTASSCPHAKCGCTSQTTSRSHANQCTKTRRYRHLRPELERTRTELRPGSNRHVRAIP